MPPPRERERTRVHLSRWTRPASTWAPCRVAAFVLAFFYYICVNTVSETKFTSPQKAWQWENGYRMTPSRSYASET